MNLLHLLILSMACWRVSSLLVNESGPFEVFGIFRHKIGVRYDAHSHPYGKNEFAELFSCVWCLSIWIGIVIYVLYLLYPGVTVAICTPLAMSAIAIYLEMRNGNTN